MTESIKVLLETKQFRFITRGIIPLNGMPDYRMQTRHPRFDVWKDSYLFDNGIQCSYAMEDLEYAKMLVGLPAYNKNE